MLLQNIGVDLIAKVIAWIVMGRTRFEFRLVVIVEFGRVLLHRDDRVVELLLLHIVAIARLGSRPFQAVGQWLR